MNRLRMMFLAAGLAALVPAIGLPATAQAQSVGLTIGIAPPPERVEVIPPARPGYVWDRGYWRWIDGRHVWVPGRYIRLIRPGAVRVPGHWERLPDGQWRFMPPHWE